MLRSAARSLIAGLLATFCASAPALAANAPPDPCSLLPSAEVGKAMGHPFKDPDRSVAPRPFRDTAQGTDCYYHAKAGKGTLQFRVYFDPSPSASAELFKRLQGFFGSGTAVAGVADEAYFDAKHALHARKGNVRFYLELIGTREAPVAREKLLGSLGSGVSGRL